MVDTSTALSIGTFLLQLQERNAAVENRERTAMQTNAEADVPAVQMVNEEIMDDQKATREAVEGLLEQRQTTQPTPGDRDAYASATVELTPGDTAVFTVAPIDGWNLRVKEVHMDRHNDHVYTVNVAGDVTSVSHRAKYAKPRVVSKQNRIVGVVTNNTSSTDTVVDFEVEAWAERP